MRLIDDKKTLKYLNNKNKLQNLQKSENQPLPEEDKTINQNYLDLLSDNSHFFDGADNNKETLLKRLFPRTPRNFMRVSKNGQTVKIATDDAIKPAMYDDDLPEEMFSFFRHTFIGWQACALLYENPYIKKACEIPARDAVAVDYKLQYAHPETDEDENTDKEKEQEILNNLKEISDIKMNIKNVCRDSNVFKKTFGQILAIPTFNTDMSKAMSEPYDPKTIKKGTYTGMTLIQPFWVTYQLDGAGVSKPNEAGYYEPVYYIVNGHTKIHRSWVIKLTTGPIADILKPVYYYGGIPLTQQIYERVFCAEKTANEAPKLALTKRLLVVDGNIENLVANPAAAFAGLQAALNIRDNMGVMVKNPNDAVSQIDTTLTDFDSLIMTQFQLVAAIAEMPTTKLMKTQLKGLANSGDYEMKDYNQTLVEIQENDFNAILRKHYEYLCLSEYGKDLHLKTVWNPIDTPSETDLAQIELSQAQTDAQYIQAGVIDPSEVRTTLRNNEDSRYHNLEEEMPEPDMNDLLGNEDIYGKNLQNASDADDDIDWITVKGNHIPIKSGQSKEDAINSFFESKKNSTASQNLYSDFDPLYEKRGKGYIGSSMSVNMAEAQARNELPATKAAKALGVSSKAIKEILSPEAWHHSGSFYNKVNVYNINPYLDLKAGKEPNPDDYDDEEIAEIKENWKKLQEYKAPTSSEKEYYGNASWVEFSGTGRNKKADEKKYENVLIKEKGDFYIITLPDGTEVRKKKGGNYINVESNESKNKHDLLNTVFKKINEKRKALNNKLDKIYQKEYEKQGINFEKPSFEDFDKLLKDSNADRTNFYIEGQKPQSEEKPQGLRRVHWNMYDKKQNTYTLQEWNGEKWQDLETKQDFDPWGGEIRPTPRFYEEFAKKVGLGAEYEAIHKLGEKHTELSFNPETQKEDIEKLLSEIEKTK